MLKFKVSVQLVVPATQDKQESWAPTLIPQSSPVIPPVIPPHTTILPPDRRERLWPCLP